MVMLQKSKRNALKEKTILTTNPTVKLKTDIKNIKPIPQILPKLIPKTDDKKCKYLLLGKITKKSSSD